MYVLPHKSIFAYNSFRKTWVLATSLFLELKSIQMKYKHKCYLRIEFVLSTEDESFNIKWMQVCQFNGCSHHVVCLDTNAWLHLSVYVAMKLDR